METPCDLLVLAAFPPELAPLREALGEGLRRSFGGHEVAAKAVGIGLPTAAAGAAVRLVAHRPRGVVLVGTCGVYGEAGVAGVAGGVALSRRIVLAEPAVARGEGAFPDPMSTEIAADADLTAGLARYGATRVDLATTLAVTTDDRLAAALSASTRCEVEHLEAYGVAAACLGAGVPFTALLGVANRVGSTGREEWRHNHRTASQAAIAVLLAWMEAGAPGLAPRREG